MSLFIRDPDVAALAAKLQDLTGSRTKTEAVRLALQQAIERANAKRSFAQRNAHVLEMADALGSTNPEFELESVLRSDVGRRLMVLDASVIIAILARATSTPNATRTRSTPPGRRSASRPSPYSRRRQALRGPNCKAIDPRHAKRSSLRIPSSWRSSQPTTSRKCGSAPTSAGARSTPPPALAGRRASRKPQSRRLLRLWLREGLSRPLALQG